MIAPTKLLRADDNATVPQSVVCRVLGIRSGTLVHYAIAERRGRRTIYRAGRVRQLLEQLAERRAHPNRKPRDPTPEEIAAECAKIRAGWSAEEEAARRTGLSQPDAVKLCRQWTPPVVKIGETRLDPEDWSDC